MNVNELRNFVTPFEIDKGIVVEGENLSFILENTSPVDFLGYEASCGCLGKIVFAKDKIECDLVATASGSYGSSYEMLTNDGEYYQQVNMVGKGPQFQNIKTKKWLSEVPSEFTKATVFNFYQTITVWFDDGVPSHIVTPDGVFQINPEKARLVIPVKFLGIKKPS